MNQKPVYTFAKWQIREGQLPEVLRLLSGMAGKTAEEKGNLFYKVHQSNADANTLILFEGYVDDAAADAHRNSDYFQQIVIGQVIPLLESREVIQATQLELMPQ